MWTMFENDKKPLNEYYIWKYKHITFSRCSVKGPHVKISFHNLKFSCHLFAVHMPIIVDILLGQIRILCLVYMKKE